jgi:hypothetical protein
MAQAAQELAEFLFLSLQEAPFERFGPMLMLPQLALLIFQLVLAALQLTLTPLYVALTTFQVTQLALATLEGA